jgi:hypothetical protein
MWSIFLNILLDWVEISQILHSWSSRTQHFPLMLLHLFLPGVLQVLSVVLVVAVYVVESEHLAASYFLDGYIFFLLLLVASCGLHHLILVFIVLSIILIVSSIIEQL